MGTRRLRAVLLLAIYGAATLPGSWAGSFGDELRQVNKELHESAYSFLHNRHKAPFTVPLQVSVLLVGLNGDGGHNFTVSAKEFEDFMSKSFGTYRPSSTSQEKRLEIEYHLSYKVAAADERSVLTLETELKKRMTLASHDKTHVQGGPALAEPRQDALVYDVEATEMEDYFHQLYRRFYRKDEHVLIVANFDKVRMRPGDGYPPYDPRMNATERVAYASGGYTYRYRYNEAGRTAQWLSKERFAVVDLSAGPCSFGRAQNPQGFVGPLTIPHLSRFLHTMATHVEQMPEHSRVDQERLESASFRGHLSSLVISSVQQLFAADVWEERIDTSERVLVPIVVLRDHLDFDPCEDGHSYSVNAPAIEHEAQKFLHSSQKAIALCVTHSLHDHPHPSMLLAKATTGRMDSVGHKATAVIDGERFLYDLQSSIDLLASGLLTASDFEDPSTAETFLNRDETKPHGTRILPVYLLSITKGPYSLVMADGSFVSTARDAVAVLQTGQPVELDFVSSQRRIGAKSDNPNRHIIAGLATALGGLTPPYQRYNPMHRRREETWMWAVGHHPFGPFSRTPTLSKLLLDTMHRNSVLSRVDAALHDVRAALDMVEDFASEFIFDAALHAVTEAPVPPVASSPASPYRRPKQSLMHTKPSTRLRLVLDEWEPSWLDEIFHDPSRKNPPLPHTVVRRLERDLTEVEEQLVELGTYLYNENVVDAHAKSIAIRYKVQTFRNYVNKELAAAREATRCCHVEHTILNSGPNWIAYSAIVVLAILAYFAIMNCTSPRTYKQN